MSKTQYSKKFAHTGISFRKISLSKEELENLPELKLSKNTKKAKDSWKIFINLKKIKTPSIKKDIFTPNSYLNFKNAGPIINKMQIIQYNRAPSLKDNRKDILKFMRNKKLKRERDLNNIFNSMLIHESKLFRTNLYITQSEREPLNSNSNFNIRKNKRSHQPTKNNKNNEMTGSTSVEILQNNCDSVSNFNNETKIYFPALNKNPPLNARKLNYNMFHKIMYKSMSNDFIRSKNNEDYSRIRMEINDAIFHELKSKDDYSLLGKKIMKFNVIKNLQNDKLKQILSKEVYNYDKKYDKLINLKNLIETSYISFAEKMNDYLNYLSDIIIQYRTELSSYDRQIKEIDDDLEIIILDLVKNQADLEYLVERRNFLLSIKERFSNPPSYYEELLIRDSKKLLVGDAIYNLKITKLIKNKNVMVFNNSYLEVKEKIKAQMLNIGNIKNVEVNKQIKNNQLFKSVDEFVQLFRSSENKNLKYLKDEANVKKQVEKLKRQYEQEKALSHNYIDDEILNKEKVLEKIMDKNEILTRTYNYYREIILKSLDNKKNLSYKLDNKNYKEKKISSIDAVVLKKYRAKLEKYKYDGMLLLNKLIELVKNLSHIKYDKSSYYSEIFNDKNLKYILSLNLNRYNSDKANLINNYIIILISKFEIICKYIINKNDIYSLNANNKEFIKEKKAQLIVQKKKQTSEELRRIINDKKIVEMKKIVEKSNKISPYIPNRVDCENSIRKSKALKNMQKQLLSIDKSKYLENEFNNFVNYADDL